MWRRGTGKKNRLGKREQLCWSCKKCGVLCSWSHLFEPIPGWTAEEDEMYSRGKRDGFTYRIYDCPEFEKGEDT